LHDISQCRDEHNGPTSMTPTKLSRPEPARHVVFTTVKWDDSKLAEQQPREIQLRTKIWKEMMEGGAQMCQFHQTKASAWNIVDTILQRPPIEIRSLRQELDRIHDGLPKEQPRKRKGGFFSFLFGAVRGKVSRLRSFMVHFG
jgi:hypothetical protein